jgi:hypothetical protein
LYISVCLPPYAHPVSKPTSVCHPFLHLSLSDILFLHLCLSVILFLYLCHSLSPSLSVIHSVFTSPFVSTCLSANHLMIKNMLSRNTCYICEK